MSRDSDYRHTPVLLQEVLDCLAVRTEGVYVDCTLGGGGHSLAIYRLLSAAGRLIALDKDQDAILAGGEYLRSIESPCRLDIVKSDFAGLTSVLSELEVNKVDGILADLGVSSWQLDSRERGFSYHESAPLDMRMDRSQDLDAYRVVNAYPQERLAAILKNYGEERYATLISRAIVRNRERNPIRTTDELADLVCRSMPGSGRKEDQHPARRTFQAIRIEVNHELESLESLLRQSLQLLNEDGRLCIISFHSLEDRMVKDMFRSWENSCTCPRDFPICICGSKPLGKSVVRKGQTADRTEILDNPRSSSARLRCFVKNRVMEVDND